MIKMKRRSILKLSAATVATVSLPRLSDAQQTQSYTPADLNGVLTPYGAIRAGNADGTIPAWTGGGVPGYKPGDPRPVPFADEKPVLIITAVNAAQYKDKLTPGALEMFQRKPDWSIQVFPTHRTAIAPQYVYDYIAQNATSAQLTHDGNAVEGAYGGIPFPIPTNGHEVMWNHLLAWVGTTQHTVNGSHLVGQNGGVVLEAVANGYFQYPYYFENGKNSFNGFFSQVNTDPTAPPYEAGEAIVDLASLNPDIRPDEAWEYLEGERRARRAPELEYDTPNSLSGGTTNWDEIGIFIGKLNEYDCKYLGKKEMYVPYNCNKIFVAAEKDQYLPHFINPDLVRWELHRVNVVEMTVKPGYRNVDARRMVYCDEDTGGAVLGDVFDAQGSLWKVMHTMPAIFPDVPCVHPSLFFMVYDLHAGDYSSGEDFNSSYAPQWQSVQQLPDSYFTPGSLVSKAGIF